MKKTFSLFLMMIFISSGLILAQSKTQSQKKKTEPVKKEQTNQTQKQNIDIKNQNQNTIIKTQDQKVIDHGMQGNKPKNQIAPNKNKVYGPGDWNVKPDKQKLDGKGNDIIQNPNKNDAKINTNVKSGNKIFDPGGWGVNKNKRQSYGKVNIAIGDPNKVDVKVNPNVNKAASGLPTGKRQVQQNINKVSPDVIDPAKRNIKVDKPVDVKMKTGKTVKTGKGKGK